MNKLKTFDSTYFIGKNLFDEDGTQNYLVFQTINKYFKVITNTDYVSWGKSKGLSSESIKPPITPDNSLTPLLWHQNKSKIYWKLFNATKNFIYSWKVVNIYIVYELGASSSHIIDPTLKNCLFSAVTLTKNADIDKYSYSGYGIVFDRRSSYSFLGGRFGQNIIIFEVDMSFSAHIDNKKKDILILGKGPTQG